MCRFLVAEIPPEDEAGRYWPWLGAVPRAWRRTAARWAKPRLSPPLVSRDGGVSGHSLVLSPFWPPSLVARAVDAWRGTLRPRAHGWLPPSPPPGTEIAWYTGRLIGLLSVLSFFTDRNGPFGPPNRLSLLLIGEDRGPFAVAARFLARRVRHLTLVAPGEHFRDRLAWQILTESGLAVLTRAAPPETGWEVALDLRRHPPVILVGAERVLRPRPCSAQPLWTPAGLRPAPENEHPVWAECHLLCLLPPEAALPPPEPTIRSLQEMLVHAERVGFGFCLA
ncbi:MAG: hypothetical protein ACM3XS_05275 [Bacteroidota bacterium]